jgi:hypothetical protein
LKVSALVKKSLDWILWTDLACMVVGGLFMLYGGSLSGAWPGFLGLVMGPLLLPFILLPAAILAGLMNMLGKNNPRAERIFQTLSVLYLVSAMAGYETLIYWTLSGAHPKNAAIIFALGAGIAPWAAHARQDRENLFYTGLIIMMQVAAIVLDAVNEIFRLKDFELKFLIIWGTMLVLVGLQVVYEKMFLVKKPGAGATS